MKRAALPILLSSLLLARGTALAEDEQTAFLQLIANCAIPDSTNVLTDLASAPPSLASQFPGMAAPGAMLATDDGQTRAPSRLVGILAHRGDWMAIVQTGGVAFSTWIATPRPGAPAEVEAHPLPATEAERCALIARALP